MKLFGVLIIGFVLIQCSIEKKTVLPVYTEDELISYREEGLKSAMATKADLGSVLIPTVAQKGSIEALEFCKTNAIPITDSMSVNQNRMIYRVSDRPRNPDNMANDKELEYIISTKEKIAAGETVTPQVFALGDKVIGYYPIITNQFCLQCHGNLGKEINEETFTAIQELYPRDKAIGYGEGEIRGIFVVEMEGKNSD